MILMGTIYFCEIRGIAIVAAMKKDIPIHDEHSHKAWKKLGALSLLAAVLTTGCATPPHSPANKAQGQTLTPAKALQLLEAGNARFSTGRTTQHNWAQERAATVGGQHPFAVVLSCIDSRTSSELIFDQGLGDIFSVRIAGNVLNDDILGSMEFACKVAGAMVIAVVGHTHCGAVNGACSGAQLGHLTGLLDRIRPAIAETASKLPDAKPTDSRFIEQVAEANVRLGLAQLRGQSPTLREMIDGGEVLLVGGIYDLDSGRVHFLNQ